MALTRLKIWIAGEILTSVDLNAEFDNFINNASTLISPWTSNVDAGGFRLTSLSGGSLGSPGISFTGDSNTGIWSSAADTLDVSTGGSRALQLGASWLLAASPEDSRTSTVDVAGEIRSTTSSAPAAGIGTGLLFTAKSEDENPSSVGELDFVFSDVAAGSEDSYCDILLRIAGAALIPVYRFQSVGAFRGTFTSSLTANRTWTLPDSNSNLGSSPIGSASTTSNFSFSSTSFTTVTGLSITASTSTDVIAMFSGTISSDTNNGGGIFSLFIDGVDQGQGSNGFVQQTLPTINDSMSIAFFFKTSGLAVGSHIFTIKARVSSAGPTITLVGGVTPSFVLLPS